MFFLLPVRVEEAEVDRLPWVSIAIAATCAVVFAATWVARSNPDGFDRRAFAGILDYYEEHPYLELPDEFSRSYVPASTRAELEKLHVDRPRRVNVVDAQIEQAHLDALAADFAAEVEGSPLRRYALVPARGVLQRGLFTHMFLHLGWLHLLGNLLFFYICGPLLEDLWGRLFFAAFYLAGGVVAGLSHFALDPHSVILMAGASGAIAACMGAFTVRCARRRVRMLYFVWLFLVRLRGSFTVPAWAWGLFFFASDLLSFALHRGQGGVAVMAHLGGFAFGAAVALAVERTGFEQLQLAPALEKKTVWKQHPALERAREAFGRHDLVAAASACREVLRERPDDREAATGLARAAGEYGPCERAIAAALQRRDPAEAWAIVEELGEAFRPGVLAARVEWQLAAAASAAPSGLSATVDALDQSLGAAGGTLGAKALLRLGQRKLAQGHVHDAHECALAARRLEGLPPALAESIDGLLQQAAARGGGDAPERARELELRPPPPAAATSAVARDPQKGPEPAAAPAVRVLAARLVGIGDEGMRIEAGSGARSIPFSKLVAIGSAVVPSATGASILTDFVLSFGSAGTPGAALRIAGPQLGLATLFPGLPTREAYRRLLSLVFERSGAASLTDRAGLDRGVYPQFPDAAAVDAAFYATRGGTRTS